MTIAPSRQLPSMREPERKCTICQALVDEEDLFCGNCGAEAPRAEEQPQSQLATRETTRNFTCNGCGASMSYDAAVQTLRCPFCGSEKLDQQPDARTIAASGIVPFAIDRRQAEQITRNWLGTGWLRPSDLKESAVITKMAAVYVPYWIFRVTTHTYWTADTSQTPPGARGDWFPLAGEHQSSYDGIIVGASGALTPQETHALCPFHLNAATDPEHVDLNNYIVEQFSVPRKYARPLARGSVEELERQAVAARYVPGRSRNVHANVMLAGLSGQPILLPVWILAYQYKQTTYRFLINGQTGEPHGTKPTSYWKIAMILLGVLGVILAVLACMGLIGGVAAATSLGNRLNPEPTCLVTAGYKLAALTSQLDLSMLRDRFAKLYMRLIGP